MNNAPTCALALPSRRRRKRSCEDSMTQTFFWHLKKLLRSFSKLSINVARNWRNRFFSSIPLRKSENQLSVDRSSQLWFLCHWHLDLPIRRQVPNDTAVGSWLCRDEGDALQDRSPNGKPPKSNGLSAVSLFGGPHSPLHFQTHLWTFHGFHYYWIIFRSPSIFQYLEHVHLFEDSSGTWKSGCFKVLFVVDWWWLILCSVDVTGMMMAELCQLGKLMWFSNNAMFTTHLGMVYTIHFWWFWVFFFESHYSTRFVPDEHWDIPNTELSSWMWLREIPELNATLR